MRWFELLKDYDMSMYYHLGKTNVVTNSLRKLYMASLSPAEEEIENVVKDFHRLA